MGPVENRVHMLDAIAPGFVVADQVYVRVTHRGDGGAIEPEIGKHFRQIGIVFGVAIEHRNFDPVEARGLDVAEQVFVLAADMRRPQEHVHPDFQAILPFS